ncbi:MAG: hypothetical protein JXA16_02635 [Bacteroidales bacterium]|nr:hypothetical protein [Bacteroidales bacterium]
MGKSIDEKLEIWSAEIKQSQEKHDKLKRKSKIISRLGLIIALFVFFGGFFLIKPINVKLFIFLILAFLIITSIANRISNFYLKHYIFSAYNPRREYWNLFIDKCLDFKLIKSIPPISVKKKKFKQEYNFYDRKDLNNILLSIHNEQITFLSENEKYQTYLLKDIKVFKIHHTLIKATEDEQKIFVLNLIITKKSGIRESCNIINIDYRIDKLEQILMHFSEKNNIYLSLPKYEKPNLFNRTFNTDFM